MTQYLNLIAFLYIAFLYQRIKLAKAKPRWLIQASLSIPKSRKTCQDTHAPRYLAAANPEEQDNWGLVWSRYQGQGQVITSHSICGMRLLVPALETCFRCTKVQLYPFRSLSCIQCGGYKRTLDYIYIYVYIYIISWSNKQQVYALVSYPEEGGVPTCILLTAWGQNLLMNFQWFIRW